MPSGIDRSDARAELGDQELSRALVELRGVGEKVAEKDLLPGAVDGAAEEVAVGADQRAHAGLVEEKICALLAVAELRRLVEDDDPLGQRLDLGDHRVGELAHALPRGVGRLHHAQEVGEARAPRRDGSTRVSRGRR
jgi:hypothetical protein